MSEEIKKMFADIADKYDFMNNLLSFGLHHLWRKKAVKISGAKFGDKVLDCACGTGDLAIQFKKTVGDRGNVEGIDFCAEMLPIAQKKAESKHLDIDFNQGDALNLQFADNTFDVCSIAFGIRNVDNPEKCIFEMARVVKSGGKVVVLEFGQAKGFIRLLYRIFSYSIMPLSGKIFVKNKTAYTYLPRTAEKFPCREDFLKIMDITYLFTKTKYYSLSSGIAFIYIGKVV
ncbi:MAG: bifunctional demethylmenaquinone methyltransferase/2-methoxy-6-polyprenyl-1,4-benzoquinol methylase UbiE [Bacteroidota bacterium]